jgi:hypothetical protein
MFMKNSNKVRDRCIRYIGVAHKQGEEKTTPNHPEG